MSKKPKGKVKVREKAAVSSNTSVIGRCKIRLEIIRVHRPFLCYSVPEVTMEWKSVVGLEGLYEVSDTGLIRNKKGKILSPYLHRERYLKISMYNADGVKKNYPVHRVVAIAFLPNPLGLSDVNHKDLDTSNNCVYNLEWQSHADNWEHFIKSDKPKGRPKNAQEI